MYLILQTAHLFLRMFIQASFKDLPVTAFLGLDSDQTVGKIERDI